MGTRKVAAYNSPSIGRLLIPKRLRRKMLEVAHAVEPFRTGASATVRILNVTDCKSETKVSWC